LTPSDGADIIQAKRMVVMFVGEEDSIYAIQAQTHSLLMEVWTAVDKNSLTRVCDDKRRGTQATITRITTMTHGTTTTNLRDSSTCTRAKEDNLHCLERGSNHS